MRILKFIWLTIAELVTQGWMLLQSIPGGFRKRHRQVELRAMEAERLDRIRHPSKYLGK